MKAPILEILPATTSELSPADEKKLKELEAQIEGHVITTLQLLTKIKEYKGGILWKSRGCNSFPEYLQARFGHSAVHSGRLDRAGTFVKLLNDKSSAPPPVRESQIRPVVQALPEDHWVPCWEEITDMSSPNILQANLVAKGVKAYAKSRKKALAGSKKTRKSAKSKMLPVDRARATSHDLVKKLIEASKILPQGFNIESSLKSIGELIDSDT